MDQFQNPNPGPTGLSGGCGDFGACCYYSCLAAIPYCGPCLVASYAGGNSGKIRKRYGLPAEPSPDNCFHFFCPCCAIIQETREVKGRNGGAPPSAEIER